MFNTCEEESFTVEAVEEQSKVIAALRYEIEVLKHRNMRLESNLLYLQDENQTLKGNIAVLERIHYGV